MESKRDIVSDWYDEYSDAIIKFILLMIHDYQTAEDLTHDTFIKAYRNYETFKGDSKIKTWLFQIAHNVTVDYLRKQKPILFLKNIFPLIDTSMLPDEEMVVKEDSKELYQALAKLKLSYQKVIILRKLKEFSIQETSEILGWSEGKVKTTLYRALPALEKQLRKGGFSSDEGLSKEPKRS
ncbi:RNA polymerase sigma factor [Ornithinibacillus halophilus]|uniref:RNA polymerase sigma-70 factor, ECF subfamily n=1 Tax=Ornithinibacillus halophilus TaxID=930117 RepID=A0A1M5EF83_9BACI|nr:RNA polymerase sigma-70 factor, ECF subfamily [Ornithinibacillus halophilus]